MELLDQTLKYEYSPTLEPWLKDNNKYYTPSSIIFSFYKTVGTVRGAFSGYFRLCDINNEWITILSTYGSGSGIATLLMPLASTYKAIKCALYTDAALTNEVD